MSIFTIFPIQMLLFFAFLPHGSLEAILGRTKLSKKTEIGDGSGMVPGVPNKFQSNPVCSFPEQDFRKTVFFQRLSTSRLFSDTYFVVKSHLRIPKFLYNLLTFSKLVLIPISVNLVRRYWHFTGTRYAETPFP